MAEPKVTKTNRMMENIRAITTGMTSPLPDVIEKQLSKIVDNIDEIDLKRREAMEYKMASKRRDNSTDEGHVDKKKPMKAFDIDDSDMERSLQEELDKILDANSKLYTLLRDYAIMPTVAPEIKRVFSFLGDETLSPDIRGEGTFKHRIKGDPDKTILEGVADARQTLNLDRLVSEIVRERYHFGRVLYRVIDYTETFEKVVDVLGKTAVISNDATFQSLLNETVMLPDTHIAKIGIINETISLDDSITSDNDESAKKKDSTLQLNVDLNIDIEFTSMYESVNTVKNLVAAYKTAHDPFDPEANACLNESVFTRGSDDKLVLNESVVQFTGLNGVIKGEHEQLIQFSKTVGTGIRRCAIEKMDPAKILIIKASGRVVGYFHVIDKSRDKEQDIVIANLFKNKSKSGTKNAYKQAQDKVVSILAKNIIDKTKEKTNLASIEDLDLIHDYIINSGILNGNKKLVFYRPEEIFDFSRQEGSLLLDAVYLVKLHTILRDNNIITKVLKGRNRTIYTVNTGASHVPQKYINSALTSLVAPENRFASFNAPFDRILNPLNSGSDIIIPSEDGTDPVIVADIIEGQQVEMDTDFLKMLLNSIINAFGLDSAVVDTVNGNVDFARTLSMISKQISTMCKAEQEEMISELKRFMIRVFSISVDGYKELAAQGKVVVEFYRPKSIELNMSQDELSAAVSYANSLADIDPVISSIENETLRAVYVYRVVCDYTNININKYSENIDELIQEADAIKLLKATHDEKKKAEDSPNITKLDDGSNEGDDDMSGMDGLTDDDEV